jgi:hypothetical protein
MRSSQIPCRRADEIESNSSTWSFLLLGQVHPPGPPGLGFTRLGGGTSAKNPANFWPFAYFIGGPMRSSQIALLRRRAESYGSNSSLLLLRQVHPPGPPGLGLTRLGGGPSSKRVPISNRTSKLNRSLQRLLPQWLNKCTPLPKCPTQRKHGIRRGQPQGVELCQWTGPGTHVERLALVADNNSFARGFNPRS